LGKIVFFEKYTIDVEMRKVLGRSQSSHYKKFRYQQIGHPT